MNTENNALNPKLAEVITSNVGNKITEALATGILAQLQPLLNQIAQESYAAGQAAEQEKAVLPAAEPAQGEVIDVEVKAPLNS